jgi:WD40 repeat protein
MRGGIISKFKFLQGEEMKGKFENFMINDIATESNFVRSNGKFLVFPWKSVGGVLSIQLAYDFKKLDPAIPLLKGHLGSILDFHFSPFNDNVLATSSEDGTVKLWVIPEEGLT